MNTKLDTKVDNVAWKEPFERHESCFSSFHHHLVTFHERTWRGIFYFYFLGRSSKAIQSTLWPGSQWRLGCSSEDGAWHGKLPSLGCGCPSPQGWMGCQHGEHRRCEAVNWRCGWLWFACLCCLRSKCVWLFCLFFPYSLCKVAGTIRKIFIWSRKASLRSTDLCSRQVDEILATVRHDITAVETNLEETWEIWWSCSTRISISTNVFCWLQMLCRMIW